MAFPATFSSSASKNAPVGRFRRRDPWTMKVKGVGLKASNNHAKTHRKATKRKHKTTQKHNKTTENPENYRRNKINKQQTTPPKK